jgi:hypothetical protein
MTAIVSSCGRYRYRLERDVQLAGNTIAFFGINPSTADAETDDQTTRKLRGFAKLLGARRYLLGNVFAWRATEVRELERAIYPIGRDNPVELRNIICEADLLVACWGAKTKLPKDLRIYVDDVEAMLRESGKPLRVFGLTRGGDPLHPLTLGYSTQLVEWNPRWRLV